MTRLFIRVMPHAEKEGCLFPLELPPLETVSHLKDTVGLKLGVPNSHQVLVYGGSVLPNHSTLSELGVVDGSCLMLFLQSSNPSSSPCEMAAAATCASFPVNAAARWHRLISPTVMRPLLEVGFPEPRAVKALLLNLLNADLAMEWLLEHAEDPDIDEPLSRIQLFQIARTFGLLNMGQQPVPADIERAIENNLCTYTVTKDRYAPQQYRYCFTCNLTDGKGCCISCAQVCHAGHQLSPPIHSDSFFCDCGSGDVPTPCKALGLPLKCTGEPSPACAAVLAAAEAECKQSCEKIMRLVRSCARNRKYTPCISNPTAPLNKDNIFDFFNQRDFSCISGDIQALIRELEGKGCECWKGAHSNRRRLPNNHNNSNNNNNNKGRNSPTPKPPPSPSSPSSPSSSSSSSSIHMVATTTTTTSVAAGFLSSLRSSASSLLPSCPFSDPTCLNPSAFCGLNLAEREKIKLLLSALNEGTQFQEGEVNLLSKILLSERASKEDVLKFFSTLTLFPKGINFFDSNFERTQQLRMLAEANEEATTAFLGISVNFTSKPGGSKFPAGCFKQTLKFGQTVTTAAAKAMFGAFLSNLCLWVTHGFLIDLGPDLVQNLFMVLKREYEHPDLVQDALVSLAVLIMGCKSAKQYCAEQGTKGILEPYLGVKANDLASFAHAIMLLLDGAGF